MATISQRLSHECRMLGRGRRMLEKSGETIWNLLMGIAEEDCALSVSLPDPPNLVPEMIDRAARALREAGYEVSDDLLLAASSGQRSSDVVTEPQAQIEDMRLIEPVGSDRFRCNLRRGRSKQRLIPDVFATSGEARAARDALEFLLRIPEPLEH